MGATSTCSRCGRPRDPALRCPHCGSTPEQLAAEVSRLNKAIADMNAEDVRLSAERRKLSSQLQAAVHQRDILAHAESERVKKAAPKQRRWIPRPPGTATTPTAPPRTPPRTPPKGTPPDTAATADPTPGRPTTDGGVPRQTRPVDPNRPRVAPLSDPPPEASPRSVQNVMLALGALLLGIAAVVFAAVALSNVAPGVRLAVLAVFTVLLLAAPPMLVARGLSSTAESLSTVGLALLPIDGYLLIQLEAIRDSGASLTLLAGLIFAATATISFLYHRATNLTSARYAVVLFAQPVLPLLAYEFINGPAGWALVLAVVAAQNAVIARAVELSHRPTPTPIGWSSYWLRELSWVLHGIAIGAAGVYAVAALISANTVPATARAALTLLLASAVGLMGALMLRKRPLNDVAAGAMTLALIGSAARVAAVALPDRALVVIAAVIAVTGLAVRALPSSSRTGPQLASTLALAVMSIFVLGSSLRAAVAPVLAAMPMWHPEELTDFQVEVSARAGAPSWQLVATVALLAVAAALALPASFRREAAVGGAALAGLAAPASLGLDWVASQWVLTLVAIGLLAIGIGAIGRPAHLWQPSDPGYGSAWATTTVRASRAHIAGSVTAGVAALGVALASPWSTAGVLATFTVVGVLLAGAQRALPTPSATMSLGDTAAGAAAFSAPGAVGAGVFTLYPDAGSTALAASFVAASLTLAVVAALLVGHRRIGAPLAVGTGLGALVVTGAAFGVEGASVLDAGVGAMLLVGAILLTLAPSIDAGLRADRWLDGADIAAAAVTAGMIASLARVTELAAPQHWLVACALLVLVVAAGVRALPEEQRRGPVVGAAVAGGVLGIVAGYPALAGGIEAIALPGKLWAAELPPLESGIQFGWQAPAALVVLAIAAAIALPRPRNYDAAAVAAILATVGTPAALGWPWWTPIVLGLTIATAYAMAAVVAVDARAGYARMTVAGAVALHALGASLVRPWTTAAALGMIALVSLVVVGMSVTISRLSTMAGTRPASHLEVLGGAGLLGTLVAGPAALAALSATMQHPIDVVLAAALGSISIGLAVMAVARRLLAPYLGFGTVGVAISSTLVALLALPTSHPAGVYAAAATLLVVLAELLRTSTLAQLGLVAQPLPRPTRKARLGPQRWRVGATAADDELLTVRRWPSYPGAMAAGAAAAPTLIAIGALAPALRAALVTPYDSLGAIWQGPPPVQSTVDGAAVLTALLLTVAATLAAVGFGGGMTRALSVVVPGVAITLLIAPIGLGLAWPSSVLAGLTVFTVCVLSVALTEPPTDSETDQPIRVARVVVLIIGLIAGGAGLAGSLAMAPLTIFTFGGTVVVGAIAALLGRSQPARILGWLGGAIAAQLFVLTVSLYVGAKPEWAAFGVLAVGAVLIVGASLLPRFTRPESLREASAVEWAGYTAGAIALALAVRSPTHVAALLVGWGAVLSIAATRAGRPGGQRRILFWAAAASEIGAWWLIMRSADVALPEAYTIPFALLALAVGLLELRQRPQLGSWAAYGPALIAGFGPTVVVVLVTETDPVREIGLLLAGIATLVFGSMRQQRAPVAIGATVTTITALHALTLVGSTWLGVLIGGIVLMILGANSERRRRATDRYNLMR